MQKASPYPFYIKLASILIIIIAGFLILSNARDLLITLTVAVFIATLLLPVSSKLTSWGLPNWLSIIISILAAIVLVAGIIGFFVFQVVSFKEDLPELQKSLNEKYAAAQEYVENTFHMDKSEQSKWMNEKIQKSSNNLNSYVMGFVSATGSALAALTLIPIYIFFITLYRGKIKKFISYVSKEEDRDKTFVVIGKVSRVSRKYIKGLLIDILILSVLNSAGFLLLGLKHAILFGVLAAVLNIVPYIGVLIGSIFPIAIALLTKDSIWYAVGAGGVCLAVQFLDNNFITPKVVGSSVSINPLVALIALLVGAKVWGVIGMVLAIPLSGMLKTLFDEIDSLRPYGFLIGEDETMKGLPKKEISKHKKEDPD